MSTMKEKLDMVDRVKAALLVWDTPKERRQNEERAIQLRQLLEAWKA